MNIHIATRIILVHPKFPVNVANVRRACVCFGVNDLVVIGRRWLDKAAKLERLPRPLRQRDFDKSCTITTVDSFKGLWTNESSIVCVEVNRGPELSIFEHPQGPTTYVFGAEDKTLVRRRFPNSVRWVHVDTQCCLNLAACVNIVLYDRTAKLSQSFIVG